MSIPDTKTRTQITIDKDLKRKAEEVAKHQERSFNSLVIYALKLYLENLDSSGSD